MGVLTRFDPPAFMSDLDRIARGHAEWHEFMNTVFNWAIGTEQPVVKPRAGSAAATVQFFNSAAWDPEAPVIEQAVTWNATHFVLWLELGRCQQAVGLVGLAKNSLLQAQQLNPENRLVTDALTELSTAGLGTRVRSWWRRLFS